MRMLNSADYRGAHVWICDKLIDRARQEQLGGLGHGVTAYGVRDLRRTRFLCQVCLKPVNERTISLGVADLSFHIHLDPCLTSAHDKAVYYARKRTDALYVEIIE